MGIPVSIEQANYRNAGIHAVMSSPRSVHSMSIAEICDIACDAAVCTDRLRMAAVLKNRALFQDEKSISPELDLKVKELLLDLAEQIEKGMEK